MVGDFIVVLFLVLFLALLVWIAIWTADRYKRISAVKSYQRHTEKYQAERYQARSDESDDSASATSTSPAEYVISLDQRETKAYKRAFSVAYRALKSYCRICNKLREAEANLNHAESELKRLEKLCEEIEQQISTVKNDPTQASRLRTLERNLTQTDRLWARMGDLEVKSEEEYAKWEELYGEWEPSYLLAFVNSDVPFDFKRVCRRAAYDARQKLESENVEVIEEDYLYVIKEMSLDYARVF